MQINQVNNANQHPCHVGDYGLITMFLITGCGLIAYGLSSVKRGQYKTAFKHIVVGLLLLPCAVIFSPGCFFNEAEVLNVHHGNNAHDNFLPISRPF